MLSKSEKAQLIDIEKCERAAGKQKLLDALQEARAEICKPFEEQIENLKKRRDLALMNADLFYISDGCGKTHTEIEAYNIETNAKIKAILRE